MAAAEEEDELDAVEDVMVAADWAELKAAADVVEEVCAWVPMARALMPTSIDSGNILYIFQYQHS